MVGRRGWAAGGVVKRVERSEEIEMRRIAGIPQVLRCRRRCVIVKRRCLARRYLMQTWSLAPVAAR